MVLMHNSQVGITLNVIKQHIIRNSGFVCSGIEEKFYLQ